MNNHARFVHEGKSYKCKPCGKEFMASTVLKRHIKMVHQNKNTFQTSWKPERVLIVTHDKKNVQ